jgi:ABC transporter substrate binding protein
MQINKSDRNDAVGIARIMQCGWYKEVRVKELDSHATKALLVSRALLVKIKRDIENQVRGLLTNKRRLLSIGTRELVQAGGIISYGIDFPAAFRRAAVFIDKILKGSKPGDIPIEQATKFEFVLNLSECGVAEELPLVIGHQADALHLEGIERVLDLAKGTVNIRERHGREHPEPARMVGNDLGAELVCLAGKLSRGIEIAKKDTRLAKR